MKHTFSILLTLCILMLIGLALIPGLDIAGQPRPRQGSTLTISYKWKGASAKVIEQNVTSRIEGMVTAVNGVESVESVSKFGSGKITVILKKEASISGVKFEIASLLRQTRDRLPEGVSWPVLAGGEVVTSDFAQEKDNRILTWQINADMPDCNIRQRAEKELKPLLEKIKGISEVSVTGGKDFYLEITYDATRLSFYKLKASDIEEALCNYMGRENIIGDVLRKDCQEGLSRITIQLSIDPNKLSIESIPVKIIDGKIVYLNNLAKCQWREKNPNSYYRVNGMNTVYMNVAAEKDANLSQLSAKVKQVVTDWEDSQRNEKEDQLSNDKRLHLLLSYDRAEEQYEAFRTTTYRSGLSLLLLLLFVWLSRRDLRYLSIISIGLLANMLIAIIAYRIFNIRLHPLSMAGMAVSLGLIIDATIVMVDHYSYYQDRSAYSGIMGAMLTTIGSLIVIFWLPESLQKDLFDFSWIIIINLVVALLISFYFVPALIEQFQYQGRQKGRVRHLRLLLGWNHWYSRYIQMATHRIWRWPILALLIGSFGCSLWFFIDAINNNRYKPEQSEMTLNIEGQMPLGGTAAQLNEKVLEIEAFLSQYPEIKRFETNVYSRGAYIHVQFKPEALGTSFPYQLENEVFGKLITIGGADWSTYGVNPRGFSNSLDLQHRSNRIEIVGYNYDQLYRYAEEMVQYLHERGRVVDLVIEVPNRREEENEYYMAYDHERLTRDSLRVQDIHAALSNLLFSSNLGKLKAQGLRSEIVLKPNSTDQPDLWQLENSFIQVGGREVRVSDYMNIQLRKAKNYIPRKNQEYVLDVAFNVLGSWKYTEKIMKDAQETFNARFPVGFRCSTPSYQWDQTESQSYWLLGLVIIIIFMIGAILFESLYQALVIILLIPFSMIGTFMTYYVSGVEFGSGGFAAMILLCGLTVNAGIYLINEYNRIRGKKKCRNNKKIFLQTWNHKIIPILLTVLSTVCGLIPFLLDGPEDRFWFSLAVGSISGLTFSLLILVLLIPLLLRDKKRYD